MNKAPFLFLDSTPSCVGQVQSNAVIVAVRNNKILGVLNESSIYGGINSDGARTSQADAEPITDRFSNQRAVDPVA